MLCAINAGDTRRWCSVLVCVFEAMEGVQSVLEAVEGMLCVLEVPDFVRYVLLCMLEVVEGVLCLIS